MDDWQKQAHIEGVIAEKETLGAILKQCQEANGKLKAEIDEAHALLKEGMEISKPKVKQLEMAVWRQGVQNYFDKHRGK